MKGAKVQTNVEIHHLTENVVTYQKLLLVKLEGMLS